jgi:hypothetical protein
LKPRREETENDTEGEATMSRLMGLVLAMMFVMVGRSAQAQMPAPVNGGFGFEYTQPIPANSYVLDRYWWVQPTPVVGTTMPPATVVAPQPAPVQQPVNPRRVTRAMRAGRSLSRLGGQPYTRSGQPVATPLPTGSLYRPATVGMPLYSPAQRYASYGQGYGLSPYGSTDYGGLYKGLYWGY